MAAINRTLFPHLSNLSVKHFTKSVIESSRRTLNARYASRISSLQPVFPEKQDELLFEDSSNEYASVDVDFRLFHPKNVKSHPCDALAAAAIEHNGPLANALLKEYRSAGIEILFRPEYEELANLSISSQNFDAFLGWLALVPPVGDGVIFPKNTNMVEQMSRIRLPFDQMYRLLYLFGRKGWSGPVPSNLVKILARYTHPTEFTRLLSEVLALHRVAHGSSEEVRWIHAEWRNVAIQEYSNRNDLETAFHLLEQSPQDIVSFEPSVLDVLSLAARRMRYAIPPFALDLFKAAPLPPKNPLRNSDITKRAFKLLYQGQSTSNPATYAKSMRETAILFGKLKTLLTTPHKGLHIDPKAVAFLLYSLLHPHSPSPSPLFTVSQFPSTTMTTTSSHRHILSLFRKRIARLGSEQGRVLWATIEVELLLYKADAHAAILYYNQAFLPLNVPPFLRYQPPSSPVPPSEHSGTDDGHLGTHPSPAGGHSGIGRTSADAGIWAKPKSHWELWLSKPPLSPLPPVPSSMPLRPSAVSSMAIWKAAVMLSVRDPRVELRERRSLVGRHVYLTKRTDSPTYTGNDAGTTTTSTGAPHTVVDVTHLNALFHSFLTIFDAQSLKARTYFSNPFTRIRYFELFLLAYVHFAPEMSAWCMSQIQQRDVPLDHRIWAVYAKGKVDSGEPGVLLRVFELLDRDGMERGEELDFSPRALANWEMDGVRWDGRSMDNTMEGGGGMRATRFTLPSKVLSAYIYGLRLLLHVRAYKEALELHTRIVRAGYREGTSLALDRVVYRMGEELRVLMRDHPVRGSMVKMSGSKPGVQGEGLVEEGDEFESLRDDF